MAIHDIRFLEQEILSPAQCGYVDKTVGKRGGLR